LLWYLNRDKQLSSGASRIFQAAERGETRIVVSAIVMAELFYLDNKHGIFEDFAATYDTIRSNPAFQLVAFDPEDVLDFVADSTIPEMHDRIIAGLARRLEAPLITSDAVISASKLVEIVW
jgi:PIN domain nuclease of toxin-antitoxin system